MMGFIHPFFCDVKVGDIHASQTLLKGFLFRLFASPTLRTFQQTYTKTPKSFTARRLKRWLGDDPLSF